MAFFSAAGAEARFFFAAGAGATRARSLTRRGGPRKKHPQQKSTHNKKKHGFPETLWRLSLLDALTCSVPAALESQPPPPSPRL